MFRRPLLLIALLSTLCHVCAVKNTAESYELFWEDLKNEYAHGKPYTGPLYIEGNAHVSSKKLKIHNVDVTVDKPKESKERGTQIHFKLTISFEEIYLKRYVLDMPGIKGREFDYRVLSECNSDGIDFFFSLDYNVGDSKFTHASKQSVLKCHSDSTKKQMPILLNVLPATGAKKKGGLKKMFGKAGRAIAQKTINKLLDMGDDQGKNGNFAIHFIKGWAVDKYVVPDISEFAENPYAKFTPAEYAKIHAKEETNFLETSSNQLNRQRGIFRGEKQVSPEENVRAGPKFHRYLAWQLMQEKKSMKVILASSKIDLNNEKKKDKTGTDVCLFKPLLTITNFNVGKISLKVNNPYEEGKLSVTVAFEDFEGDIKYNKKLNSIIKFAVKKLDINYPREFTREDINSPWMITNASPFGQWLQCTVMNSIFPISGGKKLTWKEWFLSPTCQTSAVQVAGNRLWKLMRL